MKTRSPQRRLQPTITLRRDDAAQRWHGEPPDGDEASGPVAPVLAAGPARADLGGLAVSFCAMTGRVAAIDVLDGARGASARAARRALLAHLSPTGDVHEPWSDDGEVRVAIRADLAHDPLFLLAQTQAATGAPWLDPGRPTQAVATVERAAALVALRRERHDLVGAGPAQTALDAAIVAARDLTGARLREAMRPGRPIGVLSSGFARITALLAGDDGAPIVTARRAQQSLAALLSEVARIRDELFVLRAAAAARPARREPAERSTPLGTAVHKGKGPLPHPRTPIDGGSAVLDEVTAQRLGLAAGVISIGPPDARGRRPIEVPSAPTHAALPLTWALALDAAGHTVGATPLHLVGGRLRGELDTIDEPTHLGVTREPFGKEGTADLRVALGATRQAKGAFRGAVLDGSPDARARRRAVLAVDGFLALGMVRRARSLRPLVTRDDLLEVFGRSTPDVEVVLSAGPTAGALGSGDLGPETIRPLWWSVASDPELGEEPPGV